jgi:hypothetical protein
MATAPLQTSPTTTEQRQALEIWFESRGVPHFMRRYSGRDRVPLLLCWLFLVVAFQVGAAPWLHLNVPRLLVAPLILLVLTRLVAPRLVGLFQTGTASRRVLLVIPAAIYCLWLLVSAVAPTEMPSFWSSMWVDFPLIFSVLVTSAVLSRPEVWTYNNSARTERRRRTLIAAIPIAVVVFSVEGSLIPEFDEPLNSMLAGVLPDGGTLAPGVPAFPIVCWLLYLSVSLAHDTWHNDTIAHDDRTVATLVPVMPMFVLLLGLETTVLPHASDNDFVQATPIVVALMLLGLGVALWKRFATATPRTKRPRGRLYVSVPALVCWLVLYLFTYPLLVFLFFQIDVYQHGLVGIDGFLVALGINVVYLVGAVGVVGFGIVAIVGWAVREAWRDRGGVFEGMFRGLSLLVVFTAFFLFGAELWEAVTKASTANFLGLLGVLLGLTAIFVLITAIREIRHRAVFEDWAALRDEATAAGIGTDDAAAVVTVLNALDDHEDLQLEHPELKLRGRQWINALFILGVYQALLFIPVFLASVAVFYVLARLSVPVEVAANWIYGDSAGDAAEEKIAAMGFFAQPWTRTAIVLAVFSLLYVAVEILSHEDQRELFFRGADAGVGQRFAAAIVYRQAYYPGGDCELPTFGERLRGLTRRRART